MPFLSPDIANDIAQSYQQALDESVHFSFKTINSNIEKGGLRLQTEQALDLPYVSARTLLADGIYLPTDYQANAGKTASLFKVVKAAALNENPEEAEPQTLAEIEFVKTLLPELKNTALVAGAQHIDVRMRQLLIPTENNQYLSLSPLTAAGLCHIINQQVDAVKAEVDELGKASTLKKLKTAVFGIGGANPQNVGSLVRAMQRPIVVDAPTINPNIRKALAIYYRGFDYHFNHCTQDFIDYAFVWMHQSELTQDSYFPTIDVHSPMTRMKVRNEGMGSHPRLVNEGDERLRKSELKFIAAIVRSVLSQGEAQFLFLKKYQDYLPRHDPMQGNSKWTDNAAGYVTQGLIDPVLQKRDDWQQLFALQLTRRILDHEYIEGIRLSVDDNAFEFFVRLIKRMLP